MSPLQTSLIIFLCSSVGGLVGNLAVQGCTPQETKTASSIAKTVIRIGDDVCEEMQDAGTTPEWATLICTIIDGADKIKVLLPRTEWHAIRARRGAGSKDGGSGLDTGPGL